MTNFFKTGNRLIGAFLTGMTLIIPANAALEEGEIAYPLRSGLLLQMIRDVRQINPARSFLNEQSVDVASRIGFVEEYAYASIHRVCRQQRCHHHPSSFGGDTVVSRADVVVFVWGDCGTCWRIVDEDRLRRARQDY